MHLVINSYGAALRKENELFLVATPEGSQTFPPDLVRTISVGKSALVTSDAILLAIKHQVELLFINDQGHPEGRVWSVQYGSVSSIRRAQLSYLYSARSILWVKQLLAQKVAAQVALLRVWQPLQEENDPVFRFFKSAINSIDDYREKIVRTEAEHLHDVAPSLRGWEGAAGKRYFACIAQLMPSFYQFEGRDRMPAQDPFNALLNYAYGILYGKVEGVLIKAGIDPYVGVFHRDDFNRPALVYDVIERYRTWMDFVVVSLCRAEAFPTDSFERHSSTGGVLLGPLAKRILIQSVNDYLGEIISWNGRVLSRYAHMEQDAFKLAKEFLKAESDVITG